MQYDTIGKRIANLRKQANEKQEDLAKILNLNRGSLANYENDKRTPDMNTIIKIAEHYNTTTDYLLGLSDVITTDTDVKQVCEFIGMSEKAVERIVNEWTNEQGVIRVAMYEDEPEIVNNIENEILCKNLLFEVAHKIFEIQTECNIAKHNIKPCLSDRYKQAKQMQEHKRNIDAILFNLSMYIVNIAKSICSKELEELKKIDNDVNKYLNSNDNSKDGV